MIAMNRMNKQMSKEENKINLKSKENRQLIRKKWNKVINSQNKR